MNSKEKILAVVTEEKYYYVHDIAKLTGLSKTTVYRHVKELLATKQLRAVDIGIYNTCLVYMPAKKR
jgi:DeoR/GlpR family transcriptional regulator of sugar metabolism